MTAAERERLGAVMRFIERSAHRRPRLPELAKAAGMSPFHFHRRFKACFGETPLRVISRHQIDRAKRLMMAGETLAEVARRCGFSTLSHFCNRFRQLTGVTLRRWRQAQRFGGK